MESSEKEAGEQIGIEGFLWTLEEKRSQLSPTVVYRTTKPDVLCDFNYFREPAAPSRDCSTLATLTTTAACPKLSFQSHEIFTLVRKLPRILGHVSRD